VEVAESGHVLADRRPIAGREKGEDDGLVQPTARPVASAAGHGNPEMARMNRYWGISTTRVADRHPIHREGGPSA
jgi:hypothetical protein